MVSVNGSKDVSRAKRNNTFDRLRFEESVNHILNTILSALLSITSGRSCAIMRPVRSGRSSLTARSACPRPAPTSTKRTGCCSILPFWANSVVVSVLLNRVDIVALRLGSCILVAAALYALNIFSCAGCVCSHWNVFILVSRA